MEEKQLDSFWGVLVDFRGFLILSVPQAAFGRRREMPPSVVLVAATWEGISYPSQQGEVLPTCGFLMWGRKSSAGASADLSLGVAKRQVPEQAAWELS